MEKEKKKIITQVDFSSLTVSFPCGVDSPGYFVRIEESGRSHWGQDISPGRAFESALLAYFIERKTRPKKKEEDKK